MVLHPKLKSYKNKNTEVKIMIESHMFHNTSSKDRGVMEPMTLKGKH